MKIIISIIASDNSNYIKFKDVWIKHIEYIKNDKVLSDIFDFYFLYTDKTKQSSQISFKDASIPKILYTNFYENNDVTNEFNDNNRNITKSILNRTGYFYRYISNLLNLNDTNTYLEYKNNGLYFVRTNLSTLFDFNKLYKWIQNKPKSSFFSGSFNGFYNNIYTTISGTNMIFSLDVMMYISLHYKNLDVSMYLEDEAISQLIIQNLNVFLINIKRIDFIEMDEVVLPNYTWPATPRSIVYHKTTIGDTNIFSFRFKTFNREYDAHVMNKLIEHQCSENFNLNKFVDEISTEYNLPVSEEGPEYGKMFSENTFKIINLRFD